MPKQTSNNDDDLRGGYLRDGQVGRLPMMMRDSSDTWRQDMHDNFEREPAARRQRWMDTAEKFFDRGVRVTDSGGDTVGLHRPGYRINPVTADSARRQLLYDQYDREISAAHKNPSTGSGERSFRGVQVRADSGVGTADYAALRDDLRSALRQYDLEISRAWETRR
jgi:hypothetical protein